MVYLTSPEERRCPVELIAESFFFVVGTISTQYFVLKISEIMVKELAEYTKILLSSEKDDYGPLLKSPEELYAH